MPVAKNWLRRYRRESGLSLRDVAEALELRSATSVSRWERGERVPNITRLLELSVLYSRLVNDLFRPEYLEAQDRIRQRLRRF